MSSFDDHNEREDVPFPANGPVNVPDAYEMAQQAYPQMAPVSATLGRPAPLMRLGQTTAPALSPINSPMEVLAMLRRLNPEKVRLAGAVFGRSASPEGALLAVLCRVDPPMLLAMLALCEDILSAVQPNGPRSPSEVLVNLELLGSVLQVMSRPQANAQALQAIGLLLG